MIGKYSVKRYTYLSIYRRGGPQKKNGSSDSPEYNLEVPSRDASATNKYMEKSKFGGFLSLDLERMDGSTWLKQSIKP